MLVTKNVVTREEVIAAVKELSEKLGRSPRYPDLIKVLNVTRRQIQKMFGGWRELLKESGCEAVRISGGLLTMMEIWTDWVEVCRKVGRVPTLRHYDKFSRYSLRPLRDRFGAWEKVPGALLGYGDVRGAWKGFEDVREMVVNAVEGSEYRRSPESREIAVIAGIGKATATASTAKDAEDAEGIEAGDGLSGQGGLLYGVGRGSQVDSSVDFLRADEVVWSPVLSPFSGSQILWMPEMGIHHGGAETRRATKPFTTEDTEGRRGNQRPTGGGFGWPSFQSAAGGGCATHASMVSQFSSAPDFLMAAEVIDEELLFGEPLVFGAMATAPMNEDGVLIMFGSLARELGFVITKVQGNAFPDIEAWRKLGNGKWQRVRIEVEFRSRSFVAHGHDPRGCDLIVCWEHDWATCPVEVLELKRLFAAN